MSQPKAPVTAQVVSRVMKAVAPKFGGKIPKGHCVGSLQKHLPITPAPTGRK